MHRHLLLALMLTAPALAGCLGIADGPLDAASVDAAALDSGPPLPGDLMMEGAKVIERTASSVTFRWEGTIPNSLDAFGVTSGSGARTTFELAPDTAVHVDATLSYRESRADLGLVLMGPDAVGSDDLNHGECYDFGGAVGSVDRPVGEPSPEVRRCTALMRAGPGAGEVWVWPEYNVYGDIPFTVELTLTAREPIYDWSELHGVAEIRPYEVVADDGVVLRGHVYLPDGDGPFATVLEYSPYWNTAYSHSEHRAQETTNGRTTMERWLGPVMDAGFAVALINIRGMGESGGCFQFGSSRDVQDVALVIESLAAEQWSNGNVGMIGLSYPGWTQDLAVASGTPSLKAVVPMSSVQDFWSLWTRAGAPIYEGMALGLAFQPAISSGALVVVNDGEPGDQQPEQYTCPEYASHIEEHARLIDSGDKTEFWQERDLRERINGTTVPMLASVGLQSEGHIHQLDGKWDLLAGPKHFFLGQHGHARPSTVRADWNDLVVAFLDHHLRGGPAPWPASHAEYQSDDGAWHTAERWPPRGTAAKLHLSNGALVADAATVAASRSMFQSTHDAPVPVDCPGTQVLYVSEPVAEDVRLAGNFLVNLTLESTMPDGNLAAYIYQVDEMEPCDPAAFAEARALAAQNDIVTNPGEVRRAMTDLRHRGHLEIGEDFPIDRPETVHLTSYPFATTIEAGHRIVLGISGGDPYLLDDPRKPVITVVTGPDVVGEVVLPVVEGGLVFESGPGGTRSLIAGVGA